MEPNTTDPIKVLTGNSVVLIPNEDGTGSRSVEVHELRWPAALQFMRMLGEHVANLTQPDDSGRPAFDFARLKEAIPATGALAQYLVEKSTGLKPEEIDTLTATQFLEILAVCMELNLSEDLVGKFNRVAKVVTKTFGAPTPTSPGPSTS